MLYRKMIPIPYLKNILIVGLINPRKLSCLGPKLLSQNPGGLHLGRAKSLFVGCIFILLSDQPPPYPDTGTGNETAAGTGSDGANYQPEHSNLGYQTGSQPLACPPPPQPFIMEQQQTMMNNTVVVGGMGGMLSSMYQSAPQDYTKQAWIACLFCFWPTGLLAIMKASESRDARARGDLLAANTAANSARLMVRISFVIGIVGVTLMVVIIGFRYVIPFLFR